MRAVYDVEEATAFAFEIILDHKVDNLFMFNFWFCLSIFGSRSCVVAAEKLSCEEHLLETERELSES